MKQFDLTQAAVTYGVENLVFQMEVNFIQPSMIALSAAFSMPVVMVNNDDIVVAEMKIDETDYKVCERYKVDLTHLHNNPLICKTSKYVGDLENIINQGYCRVMVLQKNGVLETIYQVLTPEEELLVKKINENHFLFTSFFGMFPEKYRPQPGPTW